MPKYAGSPSGRVQSPFGRASVHSVFMFAVYSLYGYCSQQFRQAVSFLCRMYAAILFCFDESFCCQSLCAENSSACSASYCIVGQTYEFVIVYGILTETSNRNAHSILIIYILCYLRTVVFLKVLDKVLRCAWKLKLLRNAAEVFKSFDQLLFRRFLAEFYKTAAVWPFSTGTRMHWQVITGS